MTGDLVEAFSLVQNVWTNEMALVWQLLGQQNVVLWCQVVIPKHSDISLMGQALNSTCQPFR